MHFLGAVNVGSPIAYSALEAPIEVLNSNSLRLKSLVLTSFV
jgi:hypothetical protein